MEGKKRVVTGVFHDFLWGFSLDFSGDVLNIISSPLLVGFDELVEVTFVPNGESLQSRYRCYKYAPKHFNLTRHINHTCSVILRGKDPQGEGSVPVAAGSPSPPAPPL